MQWLVPDANQAFRIAAARRLAPDVTFLPRGVNELSLLEMARVLCQTHAPFNAGLVRFQLHLRLALGLSTGILALLAIALAHWRDRRRYPAGPFTGLVLAYSLSMIWVSRNSRSDLSLVWLPDVVVAAFSMLLLRGRLRSGPSGGEYAERD